MDWTTRPPSSVTIATAGQFMQASGQALASRYLKRPCQKAVPDLPGCAAHAMTPSSVTAPSFVTGASRLCGALPRIVVREAQSTGKKRPVVRHAGGSVRNMSHQPQIQVRRPALRRHPMAVMMDSICGTGEEAFPALFGWQAGHGSAPCGPPFIGYLVIDMASDLEMELGVPVGAPITGSGRARCAVLRHTGPCDGLIASNAALQRWAQENGIQVGTRETGNGAAWRSRACHYLTGPSKEPGPANWEVGVAT